MPPKKSGRGRKKEEVSVPVVAQLNGEEVEETTPVSKKGNATALQAKTLNGEAPPSNDLENGHSDEVGPPPAKKRGRQGNAAPQPVEATEKNDNDAVDQIAQVEDAEGPQSVEDVPGQAGQEPSEEKLKQEPNAKETDSKKSKGRPRRQDTKSVDAPEQTELEIPQDSDKKSEQGPDTKGVAPKKGKGRNRKQDTKSVDVPDQTELEVPQVDQNSDEKQEQELDTNKTDSKKGKGRPRRQNAKSVDVPDKVEPEIPEVSQDSNEKQEQEPIAKEATSKKGKGRSRRQGTKSVDDLEPEVPQVNQDSDEKQEQEPVHKVTATRKGRSRRQDAKLVTEPEVAEQTDLEGQDSDEKPAQENIPKKGRGRKQENASKKLPKEPVVEPRGLKRKSSDPSPVLENRFVQVSLLRQKSVDDMAIEEMKRDGKVKEAVGSSKNSRKRKAEDSGDAAKPSKAAKASASSSAPKKKKIPDVSALDFSNTSTTKSGEAWNLKIASWNVNGIRAWLEKDGASYLRAECPDVLCVQETKCSKEKLPKEANVEGYHCYWLAGDKDGYSGVGMLAKQKPLAVEYGIGKDEHDSEGRVITAEFDKFYLVAAYVPNSGRGLVRLEYRKQWDVDFRAFLKKLDDTKPVVLCGDLNVAHKEIDLANPKTNKKTAGFTQDERDGFSALLSTGFVDAYRVLYPDKKGAYTFWTYMMNARAKNVGWRVDYFVLSERFADRLCDCCIRSEVMGSDHCPLVLFLNV